MSPSHLRTSAVLLAACLTSTFAGRAAADLDQELDNMFNGMANVTQPRAFETQRRGVISGGSIVVRTPVVRPKLASFVPPSINAGCNGLDMYGGSFSFIKKDEFVQFLRAIAANAEGYFFGMALKSICPSCMDEIARLQKVVQEMNFAVKDSCTIGKKLAETAADKALSTDSQLSITEYDIAGNAAKAVGAVTDDWNAWFHPAGSKTNKEALDELDPNEALRRNVVGNVTWQVLHDAGIDGVKSWFLFGDHDLNLVLLSMVGSLVVSPHPERQNRDYAVTELPGGLVSLRTFLYGETTDSNGQTIPVKVYDCPPVANAWEMRQNPANACMPIGDRANGFPTKDLPKFTGLYTRVRRILIGDPVSGAPGIVAKYAQNMTGGLTDEEKAFAQTAPPHVMAHIRDLATTSQAHATVFAEEVSKMLAVNLAQQLTTDLLLALRIAAAGNDNPRIGEFVRRVQEQEKGFKAERAEIAAELQDTANLAMFFDTLRNKHRGKTPELLSPAPGKPGL